MEEHRFQLWDNETGNIISTASSIEKLAWLCFELGQVNPSMEVNRLRVIDMDTINHGIEQANRHGHPEWSHVIAHGPCTRED